jgi:hypothetical protein
LGKGLEAAGVEFIPADEAKGPGVRLKDSWPKDPNGGEERESGPENPNSSFTKRTQFLQCTKRRRQVLLKRHRHGQNFEATIFWI